MSDLNTTGSEDASSLREEVIQKAIQYSEPFFREHPSLESLVSAKTFCRKLFSRATQTYLRDSLEDDSTLKATVTTLLTLLEKSFSHNDSLLLEASSKIGGIFIVQEDRPFLINTIREHLREKGLTAQTFLHPIFSDGSRNISAIFLQLKPDSREQLESLRHDLVVKFALLKLATDDYPAMKKDLLGTSKKYHLLDDDFDGDENLAETARFLSWLGDQNFVLLGVVHWQGTPLTVQEGSALGLFRDEQFSALLTKDLIEELNQVLPQSVSLGVSRLSVLSPVHRASRFSAISLLASTSSSKKKTIQGVSFVGLFTSRALSQESTTVPIIREKLKKIIREEEILENSSDYKSVVNIIDSMPKDKAFSVSIAALKELVQSILSIQDRSDTRVSITHEPIRRGVSVLIVLPRDRFNSKVRDNIQRFVEEKFEAPRGSSEYHLDLSYRPHARLYFHVTAGENSLTNIDLAEFEAQIEALSTSWLQRLRGHLSSDKTLERDESLWTRFRDSLPEDYQSGQSIEEACLDLYELSSLDAERFVSVRFSNQEGAERMGEPAQSYYLTVYQRENELPLSKSLPIIEKCGFEAINERSFHIGTSETVPLFLHRFLVRTKKSTLFDPEKANQLLRRELIALLTGKAERDPLNALILRCGFSLRIVALLRSYTQLLWQVNSFASRGTIADALAEYSEVSNCFWTIFDHRFNPNIEKPLEERSSWESTLWKQYHDLLNSITDVTSDRIFRSLAQLLRNTVRTNFYQEGDSIALKLHSAKIEILPNPRPLFEVFVSSARIEGTHLRSSRICRGGIRWSERTQDYRSEVLGLMKTQKIKNALIVPDGAKGGFIIRRLPADMTEVRKEVEKGYREYISTLLTIVDRKSGDDITHPEKVVCYDGEDPYFVVAADKGTATFSDIANSIAEDQFDFWLGDAFASGGSNGYDHKKYGITARGAWESTKRHFTELDIDWENEPFSVVGIGDMSGDVFGNGMLLSKQIKLIAAFNHKHIFLDPNPDPSTSFNERERLFNLPHSQWTDYDSDLLSPGGSVFLRSEKSITLSDEARTALGISDDSPMEFSGEELIRLILKAPVDLLWNGGIGTYVKARTEANVEVNDGTNDGVRVNADELRCRIVTEGGNLGFTARGRIEFARLGGRIHTDAIDNSAGVDMSDHEVNLKILFSQAEASGELTREERNGLLEQVSSSVTEAVLTHNRNHSLILTVGAHRSKRNTEYFISLIRELHRHEFFNRHLEHLPEDDEIHSRAAKEIGLYRPELAICLGGVKLSVKHTVLESKLPEEEILEKYLFQYFPDDLHARFGKHISSHPLKRNIIASQVANTIIDSLGITFVHRMCLTHSTTPETVLACALAAREIVSSREIREEIDQFNTFEHHKLFLKLRTRMSRLEREVTAWLLTTEAPQTTVSEMVSKYGSPWKDFILHAREVLGDSQRATFEEDLQELLDLGVLDDSARTLSLMLYSVVALELITIVRKSGHPLERVSRVFRAIIDLFTLEPLLTLEQGVRTSSKWEHELVVGAFEDLRRGLAVITEKTLNQQSSEESEGAAVTRIVKNSGQFEVIFSLLEEVSEKNPSPAALSIAAKNLRSYGRNL